MEQLGDVFRFQCTVCREDHVGTPGFGWAWPLPYLFVPEEERHARTELHSDYCVIDDRQFYARGVLLIPVHGVDEPFAWGAWVSLSRQSFDRFMAVHQDPGREAGLRLVGWLASLIPGYPNDTPLKAALLVRPSPLRAHIELEPTDHPLAVEQRQGITRARVQEIVEQVMHPGR